MITSTDSQCPERGSETTETAEQGTRRERRCHGYSRQCNEYCGGERLSPPVCRSVGPPVSVVLSIINTPSLRVRRCSVLQCDERALDVVVAIPNWFCHHPDRNTAVLLADGGLA